MCLSSSNGTVDSNRVSGYPQTVYAHIHGLSSSLFHNSECLTNTSYNHRGLYPLVWVSSAYPVVVRTELTIQRCQGSTSAISNTSLFSIYINFLYYTVTTCPSSQMNPSSSRATATLILFSCNLRVRR